MNDLKISNGKTTSLNLAEFTGKAHNHILRDIRNMEPAWVERGQSNFGQSYYINEQNRKMPMYELSKTEFLFIASKFDDDIRAKVILRWEELEKQANNTFALPKTYSEALRELANEAEAHQETQLRLEAAKIELQENAPKVTFAESVMGSSNSILIRDFAKLISDDDFKIGQNRLFSWFRDNKYLMRDNMPYQEYLERGYFEVIERTIGSGYETFTSKTTKITGSGKVYFAKKIKMGVE